MVTSGINICAHCAAGAGIGSVIGGAGGPGTTAFRGRQKITLSSGQEMLIQITGR